MESYFEIYEEYSSPDSSIWAWCKFCSLDNPFHVKLFDSKLTNLSQSLLLTRSLWEEFFHHYQGNDKFYATVESSFPSSCLPVINHPVYIVPMITFHPGHILIDLLEQIYHSMIEHYHEIPKNSAIILDVASFPEREILEKLIQERILSAYSLASTIRFLTQQITITTRLFDRISINGPVIFSDLHIGTNLVDSSYYFGYRFHPFSFSKHPQPSSSVSSAIFFNQSKLIDNIRRKYLSFSSPLQSFTDQLFSSLPPADSEETPIDIFFVQRNDNRGIINIAELIELIENEYQLSWMIADLSKIPFAQQIRLFKRVKIFVAVAGTSVHNIIWMNRNQTNQASALGLDTKIIMIMQPLWCSWSWLYENSIAFLDMEVYKICAKNSLTENSDNNIESWQYYSWGRKSWIQAPRITKLNGLLVPVESFRSILDELFNIYSSTTIPVPVEEAQREPAEIDSSTSGANQVFSFVNIVTKVLVDERKTSEGLKEWKVIMEGDVYSQKEIWEPFLRASPHLSICLVPFLPMNPADNQPFCQEIAKMGYYATLQVTLTTPVSVLKLFLRAFPGSGMIRGSEMIFPLDCRLSQCGFPFFHNHDPALPLPISFPISNLVMKYYWNCSSRLSTTNNLSHQKDRLAITIEKDKQIHQEYDCSASAVREYSFSFPSFHPNLLKNKYLETTILHFPYLSLLPLCQYFSLDSEICFEFSVEILLFLSSQAVTNGTVY